MGRGKFIPGPYGVLQNMPNKAKKLLPVLSCSGYYLLKSGLFFGEFPIYSRLALNLFNEQEIVDDG